MVYASLKRAHAGHASPNTMDASRYYYRSAKLYRFNRKCEKILKEKLFYHLTSHSAWNKSLWPSVKKLFWGVILVLTALSCRVSLRQTFLPYSNICGSGLEPDQVEHQTCQLREATMTAFMNNGHHQGQPGANVIKPFCAYFCNKLECLSLASFSL